MIAASPLAGLRVLVTRPAAQAGRLREALESRGAAVTALPTIRLAAPEDPDHLARAATALHTYDWVVFTSVNAAERLSAAHSSSAEAPLGDDPLGLGSARTAAVGPATAAAIAALGYPDCLVPRVYRGEALAEGIIEATPPDRWSDTRVLIVQAESARPALRERLVAAGATVNVAPAYSVQVNWSVRKALLEYVELGRGDWITFTASSAVRAYATLVGPQTGGAAIAAISPITAGTIAELGLPVHAVAGEHSMTGLVEALVDVVERTGSGGRAEVAT